jgi:glyoxylase-like metal-dependent hydrolase (beta-lactamase superfamily II)
MHTPRTAWFGVLLSLISLNLPAQEVLHPQKVADGVYAFIGEGGEATAANRGFIGNSGFIVGATGVIVIDTGSSYRQGKRILQAIAAITDKPVELVVITHAIQEFLFGNGAFDELGIPILAHQQTTQLMKARCDRCLENLKRVLGAEMDGTRLVLPRKLINATQDIESGGRHLRIIFPGWSSTPGDIAVLDRQTGALFAGGLVSVGRIPDIRDSDFANWQRALQQLAELAPNQVIPGHGPVSGPTAITQTADYLAALDRVVKALYARSSSLMESVEEAAIPAYRDWAMYATTHRQNALHRYLQLELQELGEDPRSTRLPQR